MCQVFSKEYVLAMTSKIYRGAPCAKNLAYATLYKIYVNRRRAYIGPPVVSHRHRQGSAVDYPCMVFLDRQDRCTWCFLVIHQAIVYLGLSSHIELNYMERSTHVGMGIAFDSFG